jgi:hypothetical protein
MPNILSGARPIKLSEIKTHYNLYSYVLPTLDEYSNCWRSWLQNSEHKSLSGLDSFVYSDYTQGTSQSFDHFVLRHGRTRQIVNFIGDFQYHSCISKTQDFKSLSTVSDLKENQSLIISVPFSDLGQTHPELESILNKCTDLDIPVCIDLAYWGISKNIHIDLNKYPCVKEITSSLSKPFFTLENHRCGIRFSREYFDDGISMINEVKMQNLHSMGLAIHYMNKYSADWCWKTVGSKYQAICKELELDTTDTIIFATSTDGKYLRFNRGIPGHHRICISEFFEDITI